MKNIIAIIMVFSMMINFVPMYAADNTLSAADDKTLAAEAVSLGIVPEDLGANGAQPITREGFISLLTKAIEVKAGKNIEQLLIEKEKNISKNTFTDTTNQLIIQARYLGVTDITSGSFRPKDLLLRQEAAIMLTNAADALGRYIYNLPSNYKDKAKIGSKASNSVDYITHRKIMQGDGKSNFNPADKLSKEQAIAAVLKLYKDNGVLNISQAERTKIAEEGRKKQSATQTGLTIYPQAGLDSTGKYWEVKLGDVVGYALETSTAVYIDGRYVKSYAIGPYKAIDIEDLEQFGYIIKKNPEKKLIAIVRDLKADRKEYNDKIDKSQVLAGNVIYTLIANDYTVKSFDSRSFDMTLSYPIKSFTTTTGKTLVPVDALKIKNHTFENEGKIAYVLPYPEKNEIRLHTVSNSEVPFATNRYWIVNKYPELTKSLLYGLEVEALAKAQSIVKEIIKPGMSEFEKEKAIYDYLVQLGAYDHNSLNEAMGWPLNPNLPPAGEHPGDAYGALVEGLAVCEGWSRAYHLMFTLAGLEAEVQEGVHGDILHAWVSVKVDGDWYQVETTHKASKGSNSFYHSTFNFTYEEGVALGYSGGDKRAKSNKYGYEYVKDSDK